MINLQMTPKRIWLSVLFFLIILSSWALVILMSGANPISGFLIILQGTFSDHVSFFSTLNQMVPIMLLALAVAIPGWAGVWNIGGEGQFLFGAFMAAYVGIMLDIHQSAFGVISALIISLAAGLLWSSWAGYLKMRFGINEIVTTLMANYIAILFISYLINYPFKEPGSSWAQTAVVRDSFKIPHLISGTQFSVTFIIAVGVVILFHVMQRRSKIGYELTMTGSNERLAYVGGVSVGKIHFVSMLMGGAVAGLAGGLVVLADTYRMKEGISPGYGFTGLLVCLLAANNPLAILLISFLFAVIQMGSLNLQLFTDVPAEIGAVLQVVLILYVAAFRILTGRKWRA
jgi:simple sugar transport system permease protein